MKHAMTPQRYQALGEAELSFINLQVKEQRRRLAKRLISLRPSWRVLRWGFVNGDRVGGLICDCLGEASGVFEGLVAGANGFQSSPKRPDGMPAKGPGRIQCP